LFKYRLGTMIYVIHIRNNNEEVDYEIKKIDEFYSDHKHND